MAENALVRYSPARVSPGDIGASFFREVYAEVCATDPLRKDRDRELLQGVLAQLSADHHLDLSIEVGRNASLTLMEAFLSLGISKASEDDRNTAVALMRARPIHLFVTLGKAMHTDLHERARKALNRSVAKYTYGFYGILNPSHEAEVRKIANPHTLFSQQTEFASAESAVQEAEENVVLANHLPLRFILEYGSSETAFQAEAYKRPSVDTPSRRGSIFFLVMRSFLVKAMMMGMSGVVIDIPSLTPHMNLETFVRNNLLAFTQDVRALISDTFFDPKAVEKIASRCVGSVFRLFDTTVSVSALMEPLFTSSPVRLPRSRDVVARVTLQTLGQFGEEVRAYFQSATSVDISSEDLTRFWYPNLILGVAPRQATVDSPMDLHASVRKIAMGAMNREVTLKDLPGLLNIPPTTIHEYIGASRLWPEDVRKAFLERYTWNKVVDARTDEVLVSIMEELVACFGPTILHRFAHRRLALGFWTRAWKDAPMMRDAILMYFKDGRHPRSVTTRALIASLESWWVQNDDRLFTYLLAEAMQDTRGYYLERCSVDMLSRAIIDLLNSPSALKTFVAKIDPRKRQACIDRLPRAQAEQYAVIMAR